MTAADHPVTANSAPDNSVPASSANSTSAGPHSAGSNSASSRTIPGEVIRIRGARVHNLQNVDVDIPRGQLVVLTGPSGSGKSSLAFDTLFAEGQRQYIESLSIYARQFLHQLEKPDVDLIDGLQPTICIDQHSGNPNPRSTVATVTEIYDHLRLLMAQLGEPFCRNCHRPIRQQTSEQIQQALLRLPEGTKLMVLAPWIRGEASVPNDLAAQIRKAGFVRARVDGQVFDVDHLPPLTGRGVHHVDAVVDRIIVRSGAATRIAEAIQLALKHGSGILTACYATPATGREPPVPDTWQDESYSTINACAACQETFSELEPRSFSFNSPYGACPGCDGLGVRVEFDPDLVLPDRTKSFATGACLPWHKDKTPTTAQRQASIRRFLEGHGFGWETPLSDLPPAVFTTLWRGDGQKFLGLAAILEKEFVTTTEQERKDYLTLLRGETTCGLCHGTRLRAEARSVRFAGKNIAEICRLSIGEARDFIEHCWSQVAEDAMAIAEPILSQIRHRLEFLQKVGVEYLTLDRSADTLSGGELQRVRLATSIGSGLIGVCYILDEPSIGLHPRDNDQLISALRDLQQQGNSVVVVEHDEAIMRQADWLIDVGPGAGRHGGRIMVAGSPADVSSDDVSLTARYLSGRLDVRPTRARRKVSKSNALVIEGVTTNNLKEITVRVPLGAFVCVTGVSGSGKSSLINETLAPALLRKLGHTAPKPGPFKSLRGTGPIEQVVMIDQAPIGRSPRSNPATFIGVFDEIRKIFATTRDAKLRGFRASRFSFNAKGGRCEECQGHGVKKIEMNFLPDLYVPCSACGGARFNRQTLQVRYRGKSIADILRMPVEEARVFFESFAVVQRFLQCLEEVGLGYLPLGQPANTLSGGEAQRIKLAAQLAREDSGKTLYFLDEPTTGLHFDDIRRLLDVLNQLVDRGNTVVVIEHNLDVIKTADWIIDLGPTGGITGGHLLAEGTPETIAAQEGNATGTFLKAALQGPGPGPISDKA